MINLINNILPTVFSKTVTGIFFVIIPFFIRQIFKISKLEKRVNILYKYSNNIPPTFCQYCKKDVQFTMVGQSIDKGKMHNTYECPDCGKNTHVLI